MSGIFFGAQILARSTVSSARSRGLRIDCSPTALDWLIDELNLTAEESLLDCGAGDGGPAA